jgi:ATP-dependent helicase HrpB
MVAALLSERDVLRGPAARSADLAERVHAVTGRRPDADRGTVARVRADADRLARLRGDRAGRGQDVDVDRLGEHVALAYPERVVGWDAATGDVVAEEVRRLGALVVGRTPAPDVTAADRAAALLEGIRREGPGLLPWTPALVRWRQRVDLLARHLGPPWPRLDDDALLATLEGWLVPHLGAMRRRSDLARLDLAGALGALLPWPLPRQLDELAPERLAVPSGSTIAVDYAVDPPVLAVKLQELFGCTETPRIGGGRIAVVVHLLSPAGRPVQVTQDLASFWATGYAAVRAELRGRYPRHPWPDDPLTAPASARTKPRPPR